MGNFLGLTSSAGVVQKVLPKRHNRTRRQWCGLYATQLDAMSTGKAGSNEKGRAASGLFLELSDI
jgi:hypothetical protein